MNEKKDKNQLREILFIIVYALIATVILASIILLINCTWPKQNLFKAETWGTISDWFTFLVALVGGVFVYKTLDSQMQVQNQQELIHKISLFDFRNKNKAEFDDPDYVQGQAFIFKILDNDAHEIQIKSNINFIIDGYNTTTSKSDGHHYCNIPMVKKDEKFKTIFIDRGRFLDIEKFPNKYINLETRILYFDISYKDSFGLSYGKAYQLMFNGVEEELIVSNTEFL